MIQTTLINSILATLEGIEAIKEVYPYPLDGNPKKYPAVIFVKDNFDNSFDNTADNFKIYRFKMWVVVNLSGTNEKDAFTKILPNAVDKIVEAFDAAWDRGNLDGHKIWAIINSGMQGLSVEQKSKCAWEELTLTVKLSTSV